MQYIVVYDVMITFRKDFLRTMSFQNVSEERKWQLKKWVRRASVEWLNWNQECPVKTLLLPLFSLMPIFSFPSNLWRRSQWHPTPVLLPGKSNGRRSLVGCSPWGHQESDTTERLHFHFSLSCIGEGNGSPLQCSCLENPRDRGAWWAAVYGVAQSRTRLKRLSSSSSSNLLSFFPNLFHKVTPHCLYTSPPSWLLDSRQFIVLPDRNRKENTVRSYLVYNLILLLQFI